MKTVNEGEKATVTVATGRTLTVRTAGLARVYRRRGLSDAGQYAAEFVAADGREFASLSLDADYEIEALQGAAEYTVAWPLVPSLPFRRNDDGNIDAVMDGETAIPIAGDTLATLADLEARVAALEAGAGGEG